MNSLVVCLVGLSVFVLVQSSPLDRIVGGTDAKKNEFPYAVSLTWFNLTSNESMHNCGGTILKENWILTAAHCLINSTEGYYIIRAGAHYLNQKMPGEQTSLVNRQIPHPYYMFNNPNLVGPNDIALMEMKTPFKFSPTVQPIKLPVPDALSCEGLVRVSGWGFKSNTLAPPNTLQTVKLPILPNAQCRSLNPWVTDTDICTGPLEGGKGTCAGDSGGGLIRGETVVEGVVAWGSYPCGAKGKFNVYSRVSAYVLWIQSYINGYIDK